jgi:hypothetical protein
MFQTDRHGNLTDDADRWLSGHEQTFDSDPAPDCDDPRDCEPRCGGCWQANGDGCRDCSPPDHENKPSGFGIDACEDPALERANAAMWAEVNKRPGGKYTSAWVETWGMYAGRSLHHRCNPVTDSDREFRNLCWRVWSKRSARRERHSDRVWDRLCDECQTHGEAVRRYEAWARRAVTVRYRDEPKSAGPVARKAKKAA